MTSSFSIGAVERGLLMLAPLALVVELKFWLAMMDSLKDQAHAEMLKRGQLCVFQRMPGCWRR
jgi:hypothetical protein